MMRAELHWNGDQIANQIESTAWERFQKMIKFFWQEIQEAITIPNTGVSVKRQKPRRGSYTIYPNPSLPGEPPRKRTGWLAKHVQYEFDRVNTSARVGLADNAKYGLWLELGTMIMAARPWLLATLNKLRARMQSIMETGS